MADLEYQSEVGKPRYSRVAIFATVVPIAMLAINAIVISNINKETLSRNLPLMAAPYLCAAGAGVSLGVLGVIQIRRAKGQLRGRVFALAGATLGALIFAGVVAAFAVFNL